MSTVPVPVRKLVFAAAVLVLLGAAGTAVSGAWLTDERTVRQNLVTAASVAIGPLLPPGTATIAIGNLLPATDASTAARGSILISNEGTAPFDWVAELELTRESVTEFAEQVQIEFRQGDTDDWTPATSFADAVKQAQEGRMPLAAGATTTLDYRAWLRPNAATRFQGADATFAVVIKSIQAGAPDSTFGDDSAFPIR